MSVIKEFKAFAMKGNVIDMAVGIVIGAAFGKIVTSFVNDIIMPSVGMLMGSVDFSDLAVTLKEKTADSAGVTLKYGLFINSVVDFLIVAFAIFMVVKQINRLKKNSPAEAPSEKACSACLSMIPIAASKCKFCTSMVTA